MDVPSPATPTHDSDYDDAIDVAADAAYLAAGLIQAHSGTAQDLRAKGVNDFVTEVDEEAQAVIVDRLTDAFPGVDVLAEEEDDGETSTLESEPAALPEDEARWIIDPIDGTTNFIQQVPPYAVSIALQKGERIVAGVVYDVSNDELFSAVDGHGMQVNGEPRTAGDADDLADAFVATGFPYRRFEHTDAYLDVLGRVLRSTRGVRRHGAASVDLARLACGRFDAFFETGLRPWDVAAGTLLVREAGGRVTDYRGDGGLTPVFERQICATNAHLHDALLETLTSMQDVRL
jgi:myo-inositol-1(or 4)-monophosphatase